MISPPSAAAATPPARVFDRLWPVLAALGLLLSGAVLLEVAAADRAAGGLVVEISGQASGPVSDDDAAADGEAREAPHESAAVDGDHAKARLLARRGEQDEALTLYRQVASAHPDAAAVHAELGYWLLAAGDAAGAQAALERAATLAPTDAWTTLDLGIAVSRQGDLARAESLYRRSLALRPGYGAAECALGSLLRRRGRVDEAIALLEGAARHGSNDERARALVALGQSYLAAGRREAAAGAFDRAITFAPAALEVRLTAARAWLAAGKPADLDRATELLDRAAELGPDVPQVFSALGRAREKRGETAAAEAAYERVLRLDPDQRYARRRLLRLALERRDHPRARLMAEYLLQRAPEEPEHHFLAGLVAAHDDRRDEARGHYQDAIARANGNYPEAYFNLGLLEKGAGDLAAAEAAYRKAIELRPDYQQAYNNLGLVLAQAGKPRDAEAALRAAIGLDGKYAAAWLNLGELFSSGNRTADALDAFGKAIAARPGYPEARLDLAVTMARAGRGPEAIALYRALVADQPRYTAAWFNLGMALEAAGDPGGAADAYRKVVALNADHLAALRRLADLEAQRGQISEAVASYQEVLDRVPGDTGARLALGEQRRRSGDLTGCSHEARAVLSEKPDDSGAARLLQACDR
jgi:tetratricopeptide (TPR) repeat protein